MHQISVPTRLKSKYAPARRLSTTTRPSMSAVGKFLSRTIRLLTDMFEPAGFTAHQCSGLTRRIHGLIMPTARGWRKAVGPSPVKFAVRLFFAARGERKRHLERKTKLSRGRRWRLGLGKAGLVRNKGFCFRADRYLGNGRWFPAAVLPVFALASFGRCHRRAPQTYSLMRSMGSGPAWQDALQ